MTAIELVDRFPALGSTAAVAVTHPEAFVEARRILDDELAAIDRACSRFRQDSELTRLNLASGTGPTRVSPVLLDAIEVALRAARLTDGLVDPTVGRALELIGYDRDFAAIVPDGPPLTYVARPVPGWEAVTVDHGASSVRLAAGVRLDLGATAKARCADRAAAAIAAATGSGTLVSLGGDMAAAGPAPPDGWAVRIALDHAAPPDPRHPVVAIREGGLATSSTTVRRWRRGGQEVHHLIDPTTSGPVPEHWLAVTVAAATCVDANTASCAAVLMGAHAVAWLEDRRLPARLVGRDGQLVTTAAWPEKSTPCS